MLKQFHLDISQRLDANLADANLNGAAFSGVDMAGAFVDVNMMMEVELCGARNVA